MFQNPIGLAGFNKVLKQEEEREKTELAVFVKNFKRVEKQSQAAEKEKVKMLKKLFAPFKEEKMRRRWDSVE